MRGGKGWLQYLQALSGAGRDPVRHADIYAHQWAHDVRCLRSGPDHRRVGESASGGHTEWLQAGFVARVYPCK